MPLDNLLEFYDSGFITQKHEDGKNTILMIRFIKFGNVVLCTGQAMARNNFKYQPTVPDIFLPTGTIYLTGQTNKEDGYVSTSSIAINSKGELYTNYAYNDNVFVFTTMYNTI